MYKEKGDNVSVRVATIYLEKWLEEQGIDSNKFTKNCLLENQRFPEYNDYWDGKLETFKPEE